jgi:pyruvate/2-oxoglutarate/acetoin dehydrogenase E1 component
VIHAPIDTPVPFAPELEDAYLPSPASLEKEIRELLDY